MFKAKIQKLRAAYDYFTGRYRWSVATGDDLERCFELRREVFGEELRRTNTNSPAERDAFDTRSVHVACWDRRTGEMVGTARLTSGLVIAEDPTYTKEFHLDAFSRDELERLQVATRLVVKKAHRKGPAGLILASALYQHSFDVLGTWLCSIVCEPGLYPMYRRLGFRPLARIQVSKHGGYRLPLVLVLHDYEHLRSVRSPFLKHAKARGLPRVSGGLAWLMRRQQGQPIMKLGFTLINDAHAQVDDVPLLEGLSRRGKQEFLAGSMRIACEGGDVIVEKGSSDRTFGIVLEGALEMREESHCFTMAPGELFGEAGFMLDRPRPAPIVAAASGAKILILRQSCFSALTNPHDAETLWKNIAKHLAKRLASKDEASGLFRLVA